MILPNGCGFKNQTIRDLYGDSYYYPPAGASQPDVTNFMSYMLEKTCRNRFSDGQRGIIVSSFTSGRNVSNSAAWSSKAIFFDTYEPDHRPQTARRIAIEEKQLHTFHKNSFGNFLTDCDVDYVYFDVPIWGRYTVFTSPEPGRTHANTIIRVYSYNPTTNEVGALLAENDNFNGTVFSQIERDFTPGRYVVEINNSSRNSTANFGYYNIQILPCVSNQNYSLNLSPSNVTSLCLFQNYTLTVSPNDVDIIDYVWEFTPTTALTNVIENGNTITFRVNPATFSDNSEITIGVMVVKACGGSAFLRRTFPIGNPSIVYAQPRQTEFCFNDAYSPYYSIALTPQNGVTYSVSTTSTRAILTQKSPTNWEVRSSVATQIPITVTASNSCGTVTDNFTIEAIDCRSNDPCRQAVIYPNPASQNATIQFGGAWATQPTLQVYNQIGQAVNVTYEIQQSGDTATQVVLNISQLPKGIYYVSVAGELGTANYAPKPCRMAKTLIIEEYNPAR
jgi:hypothetical protein